MQKARALANRPARRGGGGAPYWKDTYSPPDLSTDIIRLVPGSYTQEVSYDGETSVTDTFEYFMFREHHNGKRGCICSGGPLWANKEKALPCPSCVVFWEDVRERKAKKARGDNTKGPNRMSCRDQFVFNVWDYGMYFEIPETDKNGQIRMNGQTNQPFTHWVKGNPNDPRMQGRPWKQGDMRPWPMGGTYKDALFNKAKLIGNSCASCGTRDSITCVLKVCGNPECQQPVYDPSTTTLTDEQRETIDNDPNYRCPHCGYIGFITEIIQCSACANPVRATIFDVDIEVQRLGTKGQQTFLQIHNYSNPRPIQVSDPEVLKNIKPLDLAKKFAPTPPEVQMKIYGFQTMVPTSGPQAPPIVGQQPNQLPTAPAGPSMGAPMPMQMPQYPQQMQQGQYSPQPIQQPQQQQLPMAPPPQPQPQMQPQMQPAPVQQPMAMPPQQPQAQPQPQQPVQPAPAMPYPSPQYPGTDGNQQ